MKVYISGKITGLEKDVYTKAFLEKEKVLKQNGYDVFNPVTKAEALERKIKKIYQRMPTYEEYMTEALKGLLECEGICQLSNWQDSCGALCEYSVALATGKIFVKSFSLKKGGAKCQKL